MKLWIFICLLGALATLNSDAADWEAIDALPVPASGFAAGCVDGKIVVAGGTHWSGEVKQWLDSTWMFDPAANHWQIGPNLPHGLAYAAAASDGSRLWIAGGGDGSQARREIYSLDANLHLSHFGDLPEPLMYASGGVVDGVLNVLGGTGDPEDWTHSHSHHFAVRLVDGKVSVLPPLGMVKHGLRLPALMGLSRRLFSFTGSWFDESKEVHNLAEAFVFDNEWKPMVPFPLAARCVACVPLDETHLYLAGGYGSDQEGFLAQAWIYDVTNGTYSVAKPLPLKVSTTLVRCGNDVFLLGGEDQKKHRTAVCFRIPATALLRSSGLAK